MVELAPRDLAYTKRFGVLAAQQSIQTVWELLVELITNADESYGRLYRQQVISADGGQILVDIEPHRGTPSLIRVSDRAEGIADMDAVIAEVGKRTSTEGDRGFMGRGLKDCASLGHVAVESIREGRLHKAEITTAFTYIPYRPRRADWGDRKRLSIARNGTVVTVELKPDVRVPQLDNVTARLPWLFPLRDIFSQDYPGKVLLRYAGGKPTPLTCVPPDAVPIHDEEYVVPGYANIRARFQLLRSREPIEDLEGGTRFSKNGILIKGVRGIHECSFLTDDLGRDPAAERYFGRVTCPAIDQLAREFDDRLQAGQPQPDDNPRLLLDPSRREGLVRQHPFVGALLARPVEIVKLQFEKEHEEGRSRRVQVEAKETTERLRRLAREASRFMREKLEDLDSVGSAPDVMDDSFAQQGLRLSPPYCHIAVGEERRYCVSVHPRMALPLGSEVSPILDPGAQPALELSGKATDLEADPLHEGVLRGFFHVRAIGAVGRVRVGCRVDGLDPIYVDAETVSGVPTDVDIAGGLAFSRASYSVAPGRRRTLRLLARLGLGDGCRPVVRLSRQDVIVRRIGAFSAVPGTTYHEAEIEVEGRRVQGHATITANVDALSATTEIGVTVKDEKGVELKFELVPYSLGQNYRAVWSRAEPNKLEITTAHESISRYLGRQEEGYPGQHTAPFRVLLAELISDNVCRRIVDEMLKGSTQKIEADYVYTLHNRLMKEFTPIAHRIQLADPTA